MISQIQYDHNFFSCDHKFDFILILYSTNKYLCYISKPLTYSLKNTKLSHNSHNSHNSHSTMSAITYPPGVLTGRPMVMQEVMPTLDLYAIPEQWGTDDKDMEILWELCDALDHHHDEEMDWIQEQLQYLERYQDPTAYYMYPMVFVGAVLRGPTDFMAKVAKKALTQFEEDFDYEESLKMESLKNTEVNFHRLLATPPEDRTGWCGESSYQEPRGSWSLLKERYRFSATIIHGFPLDRNGYALAETIYGKIYIPEKFRGYIQEVGEEIDVTVALQDVAPKKNGKNNSFRFTAIYLH